MGASEIISFVFENIEEYRLPIKLNDSEDYLKRLEKIFNQYNKKISYLYDEELKSDIQDICDSLLGVVELYLNGRSNTAYETFKKLMEDKLLKYLQKISKEINIDTPLYRITKVDENRDYDRKRVFHVPFNLYSKISTSRYSIAGYPCLYLGTSLDLCCNEVHYNPYNGYSIAAKFELSDANKKILILDLGIKPQDFVYDKERVSEIFGDDEPLLYRYKLINRFVNSQSNNTLNYLGIYPLVACCSVIRADRSASFAVEYVIPQMLLQWTRDEYSKREYNALYGIRYFSCASMLASEKGLNYVFPTNKTKSNRNYCQKLTTMFKMTKPLMLQEYISVDECEKALNHLRDYDNP